MIKTLNITVAFHKFFVRVTESNGKFYTFKNMTEVRAHCEEQSKAGALRFEYQNMLSLTSFWA